MVSTVEQALIPDISGNIVVKFFYISLGVASR